MAKVVESLSNGFNRHVVETRTVSGPYTEEDWGGKVYIQGTYVHVLDDGTEIECCPFCSEGIQCIDYSIEKAKFDAAEKGDFMTYLNSVGFYTETVQVGDDKWYFGIVDDEKYYRAQYILDCTSW